MKIADLLDRKIEFFRAHIEPGVLSMPKNALHHSDKDIAIMEATEVGVYIKTRLGLEHLVPWSNCQTVRFLKKEEVDPKTEVIKPKLGRPFKTEDLPKAQ